MTLACFFIGHKFELTKDLMTKKAARLVDHLVCRRCARAVQVKAR